MNIRFLRLSILGLASILILIGAACQPKAATPQVDTLKDSVATSAAQIAASILTQTAAAASPTPPPPTITLTASPTVTETITPTSSEPPRRPMTMAFAACYLGGPGAPWQLDSNISKGKGVEFLGVGTVPGWYIIRNPYFHRPCWMEAVNLKIFPGTDLNTYPVMTPGIPPMGS